MRYSLFAVRSAFCLLLAVLTGMAEGAADQPSGFGTLATPAERDLAGRPEPDAYFREMMGYWHGVPGLEALRRRWEGFAIPTTGTRVEADTVAGKGRTGFAVLAALVFEAEGKPEEALSGVRALQGGDARWNEGRLLALLGREQEAVAVLEKLVLEAQRPEMAAAALVALTERDGVRGDFAEALRRTSAAWEARPDEGFRLQILERHLSLLVEAGKEREFVETQVRLAAKGDSTEAAEADRTTARSAQKALAAEALTAQKVMAVMADWFTADARLQEVRQKLAADCTTGVASESGSLDRGDWFLPRPTLECGLLFPKGDELRRLGKEATASSDTAWSLAREIRASGQPLETLTAWPLLARDFDDHPLHLCGLLFSGRAASRPLPPLARQLADRLPPGVERTVADLVERAWAGRASAGDAESLETIIAGASGLRAKRSQRPRQPMEGGVVWQNGWPALRAFPCDRVMWNLSGEAWAEFYRLSCRLAPLQTENPMSFYDEQRKVPAWTEWRPQWPVEGEPELMVWAWRQLDMMNEATAARAESIAGRMTDPGNRFYFAARCRRPELLVRWCGDEALLRQVPSRALMEALPSFAQNANDPLQLEKSEAALAIAREMAGRLDINPLDLIRTMGVFRQQAPETLRREMAVRPANPALLEVLWSSWDRDEPQLGKIWAARRSRTLPHAFLGAPFMPSVEEFRVLSGLLRQPPSPGQPDLAGPWFRGALARLLGGYGPEDNGSRIPPMLRALEEFPTGNPLKRRTLRWNAILASRQLDDASLQAQRLRPKSVGWKSWGQEMAGALGQLAEEEQTSPPWQCVRAVLESDPARREVLVGLAEARSPLTAGSLHSASGSVSSSAPAGAAAVQEAASDPSTSAELADLFLKMIADPGLRARLEPAGALSAMMGESSGRTALVLAAAGASQETREEAAERLLKVRDPLAARMAVILTARDGQEEKSAAWVSKALSVFPDDPELLLASAALESRQGTMTEAALTAFRRGLDHLEKIVDFSGGRPPVWCGIMERIAPPYLERSRLISAFAGRAAPNSLPLSWVYAMEDTLGRESFQRQLTDPEVEAMMMTLARHKLLWNPETGHAPQWAALLSPLARVGFEGAAAKASEMVLTRLQGQLHVPGKPSKPAPPWADVGQGEVIRADTEGWRLLELAAHGKNPSGLAARLRAVAASRPGDEQPAFLAMLASAREHSLKVEDLEILSSLSPAGKNRCLAYASWLLPPDALPERAVLEAWEAEALAAFGKREAQDSGAAQGIAYVDRLETAGAVEAAKRLLPDLVKSVSATFWLPEPFLEGIFRRLERLGRPDLEARLESLLLDRLGRDPSSTGPSQVEILTTMLKVRARNPESAPLSEDLFRRVSAILEEAAEKPVATEPDPASSQEVVGHQERDVVSLAFAAAGHPRFRDPLQKLVSSRLAGPASSQTGGAWRALADFLTMVDSRQVLPQVELSFRPEGAGKGVLSWSFDGLRPPPAVEKAMSSDQQPYPAPWPVATAPLAAGLAGQFDALILSTEDGAANPERVAARLEKMPARGSMALTDLPPAGSLRLQLIQREAPQLTATAGPVPCNTLPILLDTGGADQAPGSMTHPPGWRLLCAPAGAGNETWSWQVSGLDFHPAWPEGLALLLLDESGQVCAAADLHGVRAQALSAARGAKPAAGAGSVTVSRANFSSVPGGGGGADAPIVMTGSPSQLVLAVRTRAAAPQPYSGSEAPASRVMVQPCPAATPRIPPSGRVDVIRSWSLPAGKFTVWSPRGDNTWLNAARTRAAWYAEGRLVFFDLEKDAALPQTVAWTLPRDGFIQDMFWTGGQLHIKVEISSPLPNEKGQKSVLHHFHADGGTRAGAENKLPFEFGQEVRFTDLNRLGLTDVWLIQGDTGFYGILSAEGRVLALEPPVGDGQGQRLSQPESALSSTRALLRAGKNGESQVLDWTDGTLRLHTAAAGDLKPEKPLPRENFRTSKLSMTPEGMLADPLLERPRSWLSPLNLAAVWPSGADRAIGLALKADGTPGSLVLLKSVAFPKPAPKREP